MVGGNGDGTFYAIEATKAMTDNGIEAGIIHNCLNTSPAYQCLPDFLRKTQYRNPNDNTYTPFHMAHNANEPVFEWLVDNPEHLKAGATHMASQHTGQRRWIADPDLFPAADFTMPLDTIDEAVLMCDVGGGAGQQSMALREYHPGLCGRIIVQDLAGTIALGNEERFERLSIERQRHDFTTPQPVKGAKVYYLRNILHDWPDAVCHIILQHVRDAMEPNSVIVIDEIVTRTTQSSWKQVNYDITMMAVMAGIERTEEQWRALLAASNLSLRNIIEYDPENGDSILIASL